jgi:GT2 family glycosyltransferase
MPSKYALICINFNSYEHTVGLLESINEAKHHSSIDATIYIVDNSTDRSNYNILQKYMSTSTLAIKVITSKNVGYFPGASLALRYIFESDCKYDFISISNVDLRVAPDFFSQIQLMPQEKSVGVLAPIIISEKRKANLNPKIIDRPSRESLERNLQIFSNPYIFYIYKILSDIKSYLRAYKANPHQTPLIMYAPHGSFIIFTKSYFEMNGDFNYPCFLFGEEIFVAETCDRLNLRVLLSPELVIYDIDHGSTSLKSLRFISREHVKSLRYILKTYFPKN